jgi:hypothetical protein
MVRPAGRHSGTGWSINRSRGDIDDDPSLEETPVPQIPGENTAFSGSTRLLAETGLVAIGVQLHARYGRRFRDALAQAGVINVRPWP